MHVQGMPDAEWVNCKNCNVRQVRWPDEPEGPRQGTWPCIFCPDDGKIENCVECYIEHITEVHPEQYGLPSAEDKITLSEVEMADQSRKDRNRRKAKRRRKKGK